MTPIAAQIDLPFKNKKESRQIMVHDEVDFKIWRNNGGVFEKIDADDTCCFAEGLGCIGCFITWDESEEFDGVSLVTAANQ